MGYFSDHPQNVQGFYSAQEDVASALVGHIPVVGEVTNALTMGRDLAGAVSSYASGDYPGMVNSLGSAAWDGVNALPGASEALGFGEVGWNQAAAFARLGGYNVPTVGEIPGRIANYGIANMGTVNQDSSANSFMTNQAREAFAAGRINQGEYNARMSRLGLPGDGYAAADIGNLAAHPEQGRDMGFHNMSPSQYAGAFGGFASPYGSLGGFGSPYGGLGGFARGFGLEGASYSSPSSYSIGEGGLSSTGFGSFGGGWDGSGFSDASYGGLGGVGGFGGGYSVGDGGLGAGGFGDPGGGYGGVSTGTSIGGGGLGSGGFGDPGGYGGGYSDSGGGYGGSIGGGGLSSGGFGDPGGGYGGVSTGSSIGGGGLGSGGFGDPGGGYGGGGFGGGESGGEFGGGGSGGGESSGGESGGGGMGGGESGGGGDSGGSGGTGHA